jgi:ankyrin repeat protein/GTPase SAR1 family protein
LPRHATKQNFKFCSKFQEKNQGKKNQGKKMAFICKDCERGWAAEEIQQKIEDAVDVEDAILGEGLHYEDRSDYVQPGDELEDEECELSATVQCGNLVLVGDKNDPELEEECNGEFDVNYTAHFSCELNDQYGIERITELSHIEIDSFEARYTAPSSTAASSSSSTESAITDESAVSSSSEDEPPEFRGSPYRDLDGEQVVVRGDEYDIEVDRESCSPDSAVSRRPPTVAAHSSSVIQESVERLPMRTPIAEKTRGRTAVRKVVGSESRQFEAVAYTEAAPNIPQEKPGSAKDLIQAVNVNDASRVKRLVEDDKIYADTKLPRPYHHDTVLMRACERGFVDVARVLLSNGANPNYDSGHGPRFRGRTPLSCACEAGQFKVARLLLDHGAQPNHYTAGGNYPLHLVRADEILKLLLERAANPNVRNYPKRRHLTPLHVHCQSGRLNAVRLLVEHNAAVNVKDSRGHTPLHVAAKFGHLAIAKFLVSAGADQQATSNNGQTAAELAQGADHLEIAQLLSSDPCKCEHWKRSRATSPATSPVATSHVAGSDLIVLHSFCLDDKHRVVDLPWIPSLGWQRSVLVCDNFHVGYPEQPLDNLLPEKLVVLVLGRGQFPTFESAEERIQEFISTEARHFEGSFSQLLAEVRVLYTTDEEEVSCVEIGICPQHAFVWPDLRQLKTVDPSFAPDVSNVPVLMNSVSRSEKLRQATRRFYIVGDSCVGKTTFLNYLLGRQHDCSRTNVADLRTVYITSTDWLDGDSGSNAIVSSSRTRDAHEDAVSSASTSSTVDVSDDDEKEKGKGKGKRKAKEKEKSACGDGNGDRDGKGSDTEEHIELEMLDKTLRLQVWDCGGQPTYQNVIKHFFSKYGVYAIVCDVSAHNYTKRVMWWGELLSSVFDNDIPPLLVVGTHARHAQRSLQAIRQELRDCLQRRFPSGFARVDVYIVECKNTCESADSVHSVRRQLMQRFSELVRNVSTLAADFVDRMLSCCDNLPPLVRLADAGNLRGFEKELDVAHRIGLIHCISRGGHEGRRSLRADDDDDNDDSSTFDSWPASASTILFKAPKALVDVVRRVLNEPVHLKRYAGERYWLELQSTMRLGFVSRRVAMHLVHDTIVAGDFQMLSDLLEALGVAKHAFHPSEGIFVPALMDVVPLCSPISSLRAWTWHSRKFVYLPWSCNALHFSHARRRLSDDDDFEVLKIVTAWRFGVLLRCSLGRRSAQCDVQFELQERVRESRVCCVISLQNLKLAGEANGPQMRSWFRHLILTLCNAFNVAVATGPSSSQIGSIPIADDDIDASLIAIDTPLSQPSFEDQRLAYDELERAISQNKLADLHTHLLGMGSDSFWLHWTMANFLPNFLLTESLGATGIDQQLQFLNDEDVVSLIRKSVFSRFPHTNNRFEDNFDDDRNEGSDLAVLFTRIDQLNVDNFNEIVNAINVVDESGKNIPSEKTIELFRSMYTNDVVYGKNDLSFAFLGHAYDSSAKDSLAKR